MINPGALFDEQYDTFDYFHMIPKQLLVFAPPPPKLNMEELKGTDGEIDYTEALTQKITYGNRKGTFEFLVLPNEDYIAAYERCLSFFDGTVRTCRLNDDLEMHYEGRFWVNKWKSWGDYSLIVIQYNVKPYRYSENNIKLYDWEWDSMSFVDDTPLLFRGFSVEGEKSRTLMNLGDCAVHPAITCSSDMDVIFDGITYHFPAGETIEAEFFLEPGENEMQFLGEGTVDLDYALEAEL